MTVNFSIRYSNTGIALQLSGNQFTFVTLVRIRIENGWMDGLKSKRNMLYFQLVILFFKQPCFYFIHQNSRFEQCLRR